ncbi:MAG: DUF4973 domain-containing protein [Prevotellaceae bacterium]|jgi:hypothetical protein|nr:DUF4973 domain-containing protein [Prevotellaceae bacterium]
MKTIRKTYIALALAIPCLLLLACNDEWTDEQYEKTVSFVKSGYTDVYLKYRENGVAPYKIPLVVSGSTANDQDVVVTVALDPDTLVDLNLDRFRNRTDLYFKMLEPEYYDLKSTTATIPAGADVGLLDIDFKLQGLDLVDKYILPLKIKATSAHAPSPRKWYKKTMMRIIPFNDFSGNYIPTNATIYWGDPNNPSSTAYEEHREARVVDSSTVFFYAGLIQEQALNRALYKVRMRFNPDNTLTLTADSARIQFSQIGDGNYEIKTETDPTIPYLEQRYTIISMAYQFIDLTNPTDPIGYQVQCRMTMERKRNTLIPEEDQQFIFD